MGIVTASTLFVLLLGTILWLVIFVTYQTDAIRVIKQTSRPDICRYQEWLVRVLKWVLVCAMSFWLYTVATILEHLHIINNDAKLWIGRVLLVPMIISAIMVAKQYPPIPKRND